ncbi:hypothetical protein HDV00_005401 [Rhizophlyctis rosea]|nr:hypothetical protein HDV00_005401 [Rhizophlyctis rosea]
MSDSEMQDAEGGYSNHMRTVLEITNEADDDFGADGGHYAPQPLKKEDEDDASDLYPSDDEGQIQSFDRRQLRQQKNYTRCMFLYTNFGCNEDLYRQCGQKTFTYKLTSNVWFAQMWRMRPNDPESQCRWSNKGVVMIHVNPNEPERLMAHFVYGTKSVALNMRVPEIWTHFQKYTANTVAFSTCGANYSTTTANSPREVPLTELIPADKWKNRHDAHKFQERVTYWDYTNLRLKADEANSVILLRFKGTPSNLGPMEAFQQFMAYIKHTQEQVRQKESKKRFETYYTPQILRNPLGQTTGRSVSSTYQAIPQFCEQLAYSGLRFAPFDHDESRTTCQYCKATFAWTDENENVAERHRRHPQAIRTGCPYAYTTEEVLAGVPNMYATSLMM